MKKYKAAGVSIGSVLTALIFLLPLLGASGCNGKGDGSAPPVVNTPASITISVPASTVAAGGTLQFSATVTGSTGNVVWRVTSGAGAISSSGVYTAPSTLPSNPSVTITATLSTDSTVTASKTITILAPTASLTISSPTTTAGVGNSIQFTATITGTTGSVNWSVSSGPGTISTSGFYTAPATLSSGTSAIVTATLASNSALTASTSVTIVNLPTIVSSSPSALPMGERNTVTFTGTGFAEGTVILLNGSAVPTTYQSPTSVTATLSAEPDIASPVSIVAQGPLSLGSSATYPLPLSAPASTVAAINTTPLLAIPKGFLGLSHEWGDAECVIGRSSKKVNGIFRKLLGNLMDTPNSPFLIRVGGGSTDGSGTTFSTVEFNELHAAMPGVSFTAGVYMGGSLSATPNITYAESQATSYVNGTNAGVLQAIEIGNETDVYQYKSGTNSPGKAYTFDIYNNQFTQWVSGIQQAAGSAAPRFAGGSWALTRTLLNDSYWSANASVKEPPSYLENFVSTQGKNLGMVTQHYYGGLLPGTFPTSYLLSSSALQYSNPGNPVPFWVPSVMGWAAGIAHQNGSTFRVNEMNSIDESGTPGTSDSFAAALWAVDVMFELANAGVDGVNWHGAYGGPRDVTPGDTCVVQGVSYPAPCTPTPIYAPFTFSPVHDSQWNCTYNYSLNSVNPLYYGLYFFHLAVPDGAKLLPVTLQSPSHVKVWATQDTAGTIRIAVINKDTSFSGNVSISLPGFGNAQSMLMSDVNGYKGTINYANNTTTVGTTGITIGGQTFDGSIDGSIQGKQSTTTIVPSNGVYNVPVQPGTAVLLTVLP